MRIGIHQHFIVRVEKDTQIIQDINYDIFSKMSLNSIAIHINLEYYESFGLLYDQFF